MTKLHSDTPIENKDDDRLGYGAFATALARSMIALRPAEGFIIGVQAAWGMGKTSAINLMIEALLQIEQQNGGSSKTIVKHFNPWLFSGLEALVRGYLSEIGRLVAETVDQDTSFMTRRTLEKMIKGGAELLGGAAALGAIALSGGSALPYAATIKAGVSGTANLGAYLLDNRSLDAMIGDLKLHLKEVDRKFLVVIDDIDRLQPEEIRQILTLVKTFGNLPGVVHLLVYDRSIMDAALNDHGSERPAFREKIVQAEFNLPPPSVDGLRAMTFDKLVAIVGNDPPMEARDWWEVTHLAFSQYLRSPRDVVRFTNAFAVSWPGIQGEAYLPDFAALELFRHFDRKLYDGIREYREYLVGSIGYLSDQEKAEYAEQLSNMVDARRRGAVRKLLALLFPAVGDGFRDKFHISHQVPPRYSGRRIGDPTGFDVFFGFAAPVNEISVRELKEISLNLNDPRYMKGQINNALNKRRADGSTFAGRLLDSVIDIIESEAAAPDTLLDVLLEQGDRLVAAKDEVPNLFRTDNQRRLGRIFKLLVGRMPEESRQEKLTDSLESGKSSLVMSCHLAAYLCEPFDLIWKTENNRKANAIISFDAAKYLGQKTAFRVRQSSESGGLRELRDGIHLALRLWAAFEGPQGPRDYVKLASNDPESLMSIVLANMSVVTSTSGSYREITRAIDESIYDQVSLADAVDRFLIQGKIPSPNQDDARTFVRQVREPASG